MRLMQNESGENPSVAAVGVFSFLKYIAKYTKAKSIVENAPESFT